MRQRAPSPILRAILAQAFALGWSILGPHLAHATSLPGAELTLSRAPAASGCPSEEAIAAELRGRLSARAESSEPLQLQVALDAHGSAFDADVRVSGRKQGQRLLRAEGPTCDALHDVLVVSLLLLLDDDSDGASPESGPKATLAPPLTAVNPSGWLGVGGALTHGLPSAWASAWSAEFTLRFPRWDVSLGGLWAPERRIDFPPGDIALQTLAARGRGCFALAGRELRVSACAEFLLATLRGQAEGFTDDETERRTWLSLGAGPELRWFPARALSLGITGQLLAGLGRQSFSIQGLPGPAYRTDSVVAWLGVDFSVRIW